MSIPCRSSNQYAREDDLGCFQCPAIKIGSHGHVLHLISLCPHSDALIQGLRDFFCLSLFCCVLTWQGFSVALDGGGNRIGKFSYRHVDKRTKGRDTVMCP